ncbi:MAG: uL30 family ribosomal protein [Candidatus Micrarchaeaceae archaeon]
MGKLNDKFIAVLRVRGKVKVSADVAETLNRLKLKNPNNCAIIKATDSYEGMINKCKDYVAYGELDKDTLELLMKKAGMKEGESIKEKMPIRLHPPKRGYRNIKLNYRQGGALGYMGSDINALIKRML